MVLISGLSPHWPSQSRGSFKGPQTPLPGDKQAQCKSNSWIFLHLYTWTNYPETWAWASWCMGRLQKMHSSLASHSEVNSSSWQAVKICLDFARVVTLIPKEARSEGASCQMELIAARHVFRGVKQLLDLQTHSPISFSTDISSNIIICYVLWTFSKKKTGAFSKMDFSQIYKCISLYTHGFWEACNGLRPGASASPGY